MMLGAQTKPYKQCTKAKSACAMLVFFLIHCCQLSIAKLNNCIVYFSKVISEEYTIIAFPIKRKQTPSLV